MGEGAECQGAGARLTGSAPRGVSGLRVRVVRQANTAERLHEHYRDWPAAQRQKLLAMFDTHVRRICKRYEIRPKDLPTRGGGRALFARMRLSFCFTPLYLPVRVHGRARGNSGGLKVRLQRELKSRGGAKLSAEHRSLRR